MLALICKELKVLVTPSLPLCNVASVASDTIRGIQGLLSCCCSCSSSCSESLLKTTEKQSASAKWSPAKELLCSWSKKDRRSSVDSFRVHAVHTARQTRSVLGGRHAKVCEQKKPCLQLAETQLVRDMDCTAVDSLSWQAKMDRPMEAQTSAQPAKIQDLRLLSFQASARAAHASFTALAPVSSPWRRLNRKGFFHQS